MIDTDKYEGVKGSLVHSISNEEWKKLSPAAQALIADAPLLLAEVKRLREENETLRTMDWEYECLWTWLAENTNLLNTIEPLMEEWKKDDEEQ